MTVSIVTGIENFSTSPMSRSGIVSIKLEQSNSYQIENLVNRLINIPCCIMSLMYSNKTEDRSSIARFTLQKYTQIKFLLFYHSNTKIVYQKKDKIQHKEGREKLYSLHNEAYCD